MNQRVLLLGSHRQTVTVSRSLARAGYEVIIARPGRKEFTELSKSVHSHWACPPFNAPEFLVELEKFLKGSSPENTSVFPIGETCLQIIAENAGRLSKMATLVCPDAKITSLCLDKKSTYALAEEELVPLPPSRNFVSREEWEAQALGLGYPIIFKRKNSANTVLGSKAFTCSSAQELSTFFQESELVGETDFENMILQKRIEGLRHNCHFAAQNGRIVSYFEQKVLRTDLPDGSGYGVEGISVKPRNDLRASSERLVAALGYTGVGCVQFLVESKTDAPYFLEINPRLDATCALPYSCGVDFPLMALKLATKGATIEVPKNYIVGRRACWLSGDLIGLIRSLRRGEITLLESFSWLGKMARAAFLSQTHLVWSWSDPMPAIWFMSDFFARLLHLK